MALLAQFVPAFDASDRAQFASAWVPDVIECPTVTASNVHVINLQTGATLYSKGTKANEDIPASLTKLMTAYVVTRHRTRAGLDETTTVTSADIYDGTTTLLVAGDVISLHSLMANMLLPSDNSSASALARVIGLELLGGSGTEAQAKARFVTEMNAQAAAIGLSDTTWYDYHGLSSANTTTPADINKVAALLAKNKIVRDIWRFTLFRFSVTRGGSATALTAAASNDLDGHIGIIGGKTGTLTMYNLMVLWEAPNGQLIAATIMGSTGDAQRYTDMTALLDALPTDYPALATPAVSFDPAYVFDTFGCGGGWWDASDTSHMWQDAAGSTPVTGASQPVGKWSPKSGSAGLYFRQTTDASRPTYDGTDLNFDGTNDYLDLGATAFGNTSLFADAGEQFMVFQRAAATSGSAEPLISKAGSTAGSRTLHSYVNATAGGDAYLIVRGASNGTDENLGAGQLKLNFFWDGADGAHTRNALGSRHLLVGTASEETGENILLGSRTGGTSEFLNGSVQDIVLVDGYDADTYRRLRDWANGATVNAYPYSAGMVEAPTLSALIASNVTSSGCTASVSISNNAAGTLYLAAYPSDQTPTWTRPNWSGTPTYSDSDTDSGSGSTFQWTPDVSGLSAGVEYRLWAIWDDGAQSSNGPISSDAFKADTVHSVEGTLSCASSITGSALRFRAHAADGSLVAGSGAISGEAQRTGQATVHEASGALITGSGSITGSASRVRLHDVSGALSVGSGSISGEATRSTPGAGSFSTPPIKNNTGTLLANVSGWTVNVYNVSTGAFVVQKTGLATDASGVLTITDSAIVAATTYSYEPVHATYGRRLPTAVAA